MEPHEDVLDGAAQAVVHREARAVPAARVAEAALLLQDDVAVLLFPLPDLLQKGLAAHLFAVLALLFQLPLDDVLRGDAGVVEAGNPERLEALHPLHAREQVLHRVLQRVAHVEAARDVGRRHRDHEGLFLARVDLLLVGVKKPPASQKAYHFSSTCAGS